MHCGVGGNSTCRGLPAACSPYVPPLAIPQFMHIVAQRVCVRCSFIAKLNVVNITNPSSLFLQEVLAKICLRESDAQFTVTT